MAFGEKLKGCGFLSCGCSSLGEELVSSPGERQLPKLRAASSNLVARSSPPDAGSGEFRIDLTDQDLIIRVSEAGRHLLPLDAYLRGLPVLAEEELPEIYIRQIRAAERFLADRDLWSDPDRFRPLTVPGLRGLRAIATERPCRDLVLLEEGEAVACIRGGLPLVAPEHRGRGLGTLLVLISDINGGRFLCPVSYSEAGYRARQSAHTLQVRIMSGPAPQDGSGELVISMHR